MSDRDDFEEALVQYVCDGKVTAEFMTMHRHSDDQYAFDSPLTTGVVNAAYWAWRHQQVRFMAQLGKESDHVVH